MSFLLFGEVSSPPTGEGWHIPTLQLSPTSQAPRANLASGICVLLPVVHHVWQQVSVKHPWTASPRSSRPGQRREAATPSLHSMSHHLEKIRESSPTSPLPPPIPELRGKQCPVLPGAHPTTTPKAMCQDHRGPSPVTGQLYDGRTWKPEGAAAGRG